MGREREWLRKTQRERKKKTKIYDRRFTQNKTERGMH